MNNPHASDLTPARGSKLQVQIYVNRRPGDLSQTVLAALPTLAERTRKLCWTAPLEHERFAEPSDEQFLRAVGYGDLADQLSSFWPARGPVWDALAVAVLPSGRPGIVLAEGKSYPGEFHGGGAQAVSDSSKQKISAALVATQRWLGVEEDADRWLGSLYQSANRYAHLYWLREVVGVEAWLAHILFLEDKTHRSASRAEWESELPRIERKLGLEGVTVPHAGHAFLPALAQAELLRSPEPADEVKGAE